MATILRSSCRGVTAPNKHDLIKHNTVRDRAWKALIVWSGIDPNQSDRGNVEHVVQEILNNS